MCSICPMCSVQPGNYLFDKGVHCGHCLSAMTFSYPDEEIDDTRYTLYRHYEDNGRLLYVGITNSGNRRLHQHSKSSDWFHLVDYSTYKHYDTRKDALDAEWVAIRDEHPEFNERRCPPPHWKPGQIEPPPIYTLDLNKLMKEL